MRSIIAPSLLVSYITILCSIVVSNKIVSGFSRSTPTKTILSSPVSLSSSPPSSLSFVAHHQRKKMSSSSRRSNNSDNISIGDDNENVVGNSRVITSSSNTFCSLSDSSTSSGLSSSSINGLQVKGGETTMTDCVANEGGSIMNKVGSFWGTFGVVYILAKAIKRVLPIALEPFNGVGAQPLSRFQLIAYVTTCLWFAYVEGYKGFQCKFSPLVVKRSQTLKSGSSSFIDFLLAPLYSMGLFHATKKRMIVSWSISIGVAVIVAAVKKLPYPWRNIIDAGVVAGLGYGSLSILVIAAKAYIFKQPPSINPELPTKTADKAAN